MQAFLVKEPKELFAHPAERRSIGIVLGCRVPVGLLLAKLTRQRPSWQERARDWAIAQNFRNAAISRARFPVFATFAPAANRYTGTPSRL